MTSVDFAHSEPLTLGIEEEFLLLEQDDVRQIAPRADALLDGDWQTIASPGGWLKAELLRCSVELATAPSARLDQLDVDLTALRNELLARAGAHEMQLAAIGMHPDLVVEPGLVTPTEAHAAIAELHARVGTLGEQTTHGVHVHVGVPSLADALRVMDALAAYVPLFVALSANSPMRDGQRSRWRSARAEVLRRMLWAGATPRFSGVEEYAAVHAAHQLENAGEQRFLWEVAPVPALGTVEVRAFDAQLDSAHIFVFATLVQGIAAYVLDGGRVVRPNESLERHNRWSAMEFGTRARLLVAGRDAPVDVAELVGDLIELVQPYARDLGNAAWLEPILGLVESPPVERLIEQLEAGGVEAVLRASCVPRA